MRSATRLGEMLRCYREDHNLSTRAAAARIGITVSTYNRIESTSAAVRVESFLKICAWLLSRQDMHRRGHR